jgi:hypothetical protein
LAIGSGLIVFHRRPRIWLSDLDPDLGLGLYTLLRALVDLATPHTLTGEVLWLQDWRAAADHREALAHLAIDDGASDRTLAWALPNRVAGAVHERNIVRITAYRWTRRVRDLTIVGQARRPHESTTFADIDAMMATMASDRTAAGAVRASGWISHLTGWLAS